ncbi:MAG: acetate uptake transporter [Clostridia bacterium]|nr:acetate uptake transporter [Clostridia bacterium]
MSDNSSNVNAKIVTANPSALGLLGLAMITLVASSQKLGWTESTSLIIPWAIFLGASAQLYASISDSKLNNTFGATAFGGYAFFWYAIGFTWLIQNGAFGETIMEKMDSSQLGFAFIGYLIFSFYMTIGAMEKDKVLFIIFVLIDCLFVGLSFSSFHIGYEFFHGFAAYSEFAIAMVSFYGSAAAVLNTHFEKEFLPVGKPFGVFK